MYWCLIVKKYAWWCQIIYKRIVAKCVERLNHFVFKLFWLMVMSFVFQPLNQNLSSAAARCPTGLIWFQRRKDVVLAAPSSLWLGRWPSHPRWGGAPCHYALWPWLGRDLHAGLFFTFWIWFQFLAFNSDYRANKEEKTQN